MCVGVWNLKKTGKDLIFLSNRTRTRTLTQQLITLVEFYFRFPVSIVCCVMLFVVSKMIVAICSPRINSFCTVRVHSTRFRLMDFAFIVGMVMLRCFNRCKHTFNCDSASFASSLSSMIAALHVWWYFLRVHTSIASVNTMFQCLSNASMKPVTWPFTVVAFRVNIWRSNWRKLH